MQNFSGFTLIVIVGLLIIFLIVLTVGGWVISRTSQKSDKEFREEHEKKKAYRQAMRVNGITAPAVIISAKRITGGRSTHVVDFGVEIRLEGESPFQAVFRDEISRSNFEVKNYQMVDEIGRKIWVTYNPNDHSQMFLDHYDEDHEAVLKNRELEMRRGEFDKRIAMNADIKKTGEQAEAVITQVEDLDLPYPAVYPSKGMRFWLNVTPKTGAVFTAELDAIIAEQSINKYSAGKKVYVRFDALNPQRVVFDSERNKSLG